MPTYTLRMTCSKSRLSRSIGIVGKAAMLVPLGLLGGCQAVVLSPSGDIAAQQRDLIVIATVLMLLIIVPVMVLTVLFARKYRQQADGADYRPDWDHSTALELVIWSAPLLIIICLGAVTWSATHKLDPYRPIERIDSGRAVANAVKPLDIQVVALDWKWLFIYPEYGVASVNELAAPVDRPVTFHLTSSSVMNAFYIPALAGMIYTMPGMETKLHAVINKPGDYEGFSSNFSGDGFSGMRFRFHGVNEQQFAQWIDAAKGQGSTLDRARYLQLEQPSKNMPVMHFAKVPPDLYDAVVNQCVAPGTRCMADMMHADAVTAGTGPAQTHTHAMAMASDDMTSGTAAGPLRGAGLLPPGAQRLRERVVHNAMRDDLRGTAHSFHPTIDAVKSGL